MKIGFIGAGRVGCTMGKYLVMNGAEVTGYWSRTPEHAKEAAEFTDTTYYEAVNDLIDNSDAVILTVSDDAIRKVFKWICEVADMKEKIVCHTSGATSSGVFDDAPYQVYGYSIHPVYACSDRFNSYKTFSNAFITIEGHEKYLGSVREVFDNAGLTTGVIDDPGSKIRYHAAAVIASNLVCGMYEAAAELLESCGFDRTQAETALNGLFLDNATGIVNKGVTAQLTGPLDRGDAGTIRAHLDSFTEEESKVYIEASKYVLEIAKRKNKDRDYSEIESLLKGETL